MYFSNRHRKEMSMIFEEWDVKEVLTVKQFLIKPLIAAVFEGLV